LVPEQSSGVCHEGKQHWSGRPKLVFDGTLAGRSYDEVSAEVQKVLKDNCVSFKYVRDALLQGANDATSQIALKSPVSKPEFDRLVRIIRGLDGSLDAYLSDEYTAQMVQRQWFAMGRLHMSYLLWQVLNNITPDFDETGETVAFILRSGEIPIFQTGNCVTYAEERTVTSRSRSYQGLSLPVGGGIYYHIGGSQGHQERTSGLLPLDGGKILVTTQSLYFGGQEKTLRIPLDRVLRYQPYVDGVGVCESQGAPKVFVFDYRGMDVGWFFYNLLSALSKPQTGHEASGEKQGTQTDQSVANLQNAFDTFQAANDSFTDLMKNAVVNKVTITTDDLATYATTVDRFFSAARALEEQFQFASTAAKEKYDQSLQSMEKSWTTFASVEDAHMNGDAYIPFLDDVAAFMKARNDYVLGG
jgi:hypothetical protein